VRLCHCYSKYDTGCERFADLQDIQNAIIHKWNDDTKNRHFCSRKISNSICETECRTDSAHFLLSI